MIKRAIGLLTVLLFTGSVFAEGEMSRDYKAEAKQAVERAVAWLLAQQAEDGHWSNPDFPALTGLPVWALCRAGMKDSPEAKKAVDWILTATHEDGSICRTPKKVEKGGGLCNYNTALCMVALYETGRADLIPYVQRARTFVAGSQHLGDDIYSGGMGYDPETGRPYADLSNSYLAYEAMRLTQVVEDLRAGKEGAKADLDWDAAKQFISRVQNLPESNDQPWASDDPAERGGFAYKPDSSQAGSVTNADGTVRFRSYGSMTYAGLLSFIHADVDKNDPRVQSAFDWSTRFWTLDENPGMGKQGLYYYYHTMVKALAAYGEDNIKRPDGSTLQWRDETIRKIVSLQRPGEKEGQGFWVNDVGRWWESDPVLVTSYMLLALQIASAH